MVVATRDFDDSHAALGLLLVFNSINLKLLISNLFVVIVVLLPVQRPLWVGPALAIAFVLMFLEETLAVVGMACCLAGAGRDRVSRRCGAGVRARGGAPSLIVTLGFFLPQILRPTLGGEAQDPTTAWSLALAAGTAVRICSFVCSCRQTRHRERRRPGSRPLAAAAAGVRAAAGRRRGGRRGPRGCRGGHCRALDRLVDPALFAYGYYLLILRQAVVDTGTGDA